MNTFTLTIVACKAVVFKGQARLCRVVTSEGAIGLEARHEPLLAVLKEGSDIVYTDATGKAFSIAVANGLLSFKENTCTITMEPLPNAR